MAGEAFRPPGPSLWPWTVREVRPGWHQVGPWLPWQDRRVRRAAVAVTGLAVAWSAWEVAGVVAAATVAALAGAWRLTRPHTTRPRTARPRL